MSTKVKVVTIGGGTGLSVLIFPELPPSSATVTIAVISRGYFFKPLKRTDNPVPPPIVTTFTLVLILLPTLVNVAMF